MIAFSEGEVQKTGKLQMEKTCHNINTPQIDHKMILLQDSIDDMWQKWLIPGVIPVSL